MGNKESKTYKWIIDKQFDFCFGHRVWSQSLNTKYSLDGCLACRHLHGHQGKVKLFLGSNDLQKGMVTDFKHTNIFKKWLDDVMDHKFIIDRNDPLFNSICCEMVFEGGMDDAMSHTYHDKDYDYSRFTEGYVDEVLASSDFHGLNEAEKEAIREKYEGLIIVDFVPTSENLCKWWYEVANKMLKDLGIDVVAVEYWETPKSHCRYDGSL